MRIAGRRVALLGFLLLSICFFLPQVKGCNEPIVPAEEVTGGNPDLLLTVFSPFLFGFLGLVIYAIVNLARRARVERVIAWVWCTLCTVLLLIVSVPSALKCKEGGGPGAGPFVVALEGLLTAMLVVTAAVSARPFRRLPLCTLFCSAFSLAYFVWWIVQTLDGLYLYYGIWLSATSCVLITAGALLDVLAPPPELVPSVDL